MKKQVYLIRHGESQAQTGGSQNHVNPPLSALGERQARALRNRLAGIEVDRVLLSPLNRAWNTYLLSEFEIDRNKVFFEKRFTESDWGIEGFYQNLRCDNLPDIADNDPTENHLLPTMERVSSLCEELLSSDIQRYMLFGHWAIISDFFKGFFGCPQIHAQVGNASITLLEVDGNGNRVIHYVNDQRHLSAICDAREAMVAETAAVSKKSAAT
jgi:broad specificity phosphatase PhoE